MKNYLRYCLFLTVFLFASNLHAASPKRMPEYDWSDKLGRGALNIVSSPIEVARQIQVETNEKSMLAGWTLGLVKGFGYGVLRFGAGVIDLFTFPFNWPDEDKGPLVEPEFVWEKPGVNYV